MINLLKSISFLLGSDSSFFHLWRSYERYKSQILEKVFFLYNPNVSLLLCLLIARNSELFAEAEAGNSLDIDKMIIADSAYPLKGWLITPFKDNCRLRVNQRRFKRILFSARQSVERCSGHLKGRIRWLHKIPFRNPVDTRSLIVSI